MFINYQYSKQDRNILKDENTRLATRVKFLEGQHNIKDRIFQDLYNAAFQYNGTLMHKAYPKFSKKDRSTSPNGQKKGKVGNKML